MSKNKMDAEFGGKFPTQDHLMYCDEETGEFFTVHDTIYIKSVMYRNPATIVFWSDGDKTVSKCHGLDTYNPEMGILMCCMKKLYGTDQVRNLLRDWVPEEAYKGDASLTLKQLRQLSRNK